MRRPWYQARLVLIALTLALLTDPVQAGRVLYRVNDLGDFRPTALNNRGQVVGQQSGSEGNWAVLYEGGRLRDLTVRTRLAGAEDINDRGQIVGFASFGGEAHAFLREPGESSIRDLGTFGGPSSRATGINERGEVVGSADVRLEEAHAFLFRAGVTRDLGTIPSGPDNDSEAADINEAGSVVGFTGDLFGGVRTGFLYDNGQMRSLGTLPAGTGFVFSFAHAINDDGLIAGRSVAADGLQHAVLWEDSIIRDLGRLGQKFETIAEAVNDEGVVVGSGDNVAFIYDGAGLTPLDELLVANDRGWHLEQAVDINDLGEIVGTGISPDGTSRAFLLTPVPDKGGNGVPLPPAAWAGVTTFAMAAGLQWVKQRAKDTHM